MARLQWASFWRYEGNHPLGCDRPRTNPYGYPLTLIARSAYEEEDGTRIRTGRYDGFGREVVIGQSREDWEQDWVRYARELGDELLSDYGLTGVERDEYGQFWLTGAEEVNFEVFPVSEDETLLEQIKAGYILISLDGANYLRKTSLW